MAFYFAYKRFQETTAGRTRAPSKQPVKITVCLPARWASSRLPGKLARSWRGRPVLAHTIDIAQAADLGPVCVLSDDARLDEIASRVNVHRVDGPFRNGSERIAGAVRRGLLGAPEILVNLQADAVGATPEAVRAAVEALRADPVATLGTVAVRAPRELVPRRTTVAAAKRRALYFSRHPLPARRSGDPTVLAHLGIYAYRVDRLLELSEVAPGPLEHAEGLEQLRWLENGDAVALAILDGAPELALAVDSAADLVEAAQQHPADRVDGGR